MFVSAKRGRGNECVAVKRELGTGVRGVVRKSGEGDGEGESMCG